MFSLNFDFKGFYLFLGNVLFFNATICFKKSFYNSGNSHIEEIVCVSPYILYRLALRVFFIFLKSDQKIAQNLKGYWPRLLIYKN